MKLRDCRHGVLVTTEDGRIGMIKGITNNISCAALRDRQQPEVAIPLVEWSSGDICGIHQGNLSVYKGDL